MTKKKKKYNIRWNRVLFTLLIPVVLIFLIYFFVTQNNYDDKLKDANYSTDEISVIKKNLSSSEMNKLLDYDHLAYIDDLIGTDGFSQSKLFDYVDYIQELDQEYDLESVVYLVNEEITYPYSAKLAGVVSHDYYIANRLDRYMAYDSSDIDQIITNVNSNLDYDFYTNITKSDISKETLLIVNKYYQLDRDYYYGELVTIDSKYDNKSGSKLSSVAYEAFKKLVDAGEEEGYYIRNNSAYRSYSTQSGLYNNYKNQHGLDWADKWSARAGHSEHQTGLALDVGARSEYALGEFESSPEFTWIKDHAHLYGFIMRYPKGKEYITGYGYEPWHYRYVGVEAATYIYENDITFEEYYAYFIENN